LEEGECHIIEFTSLGPTVYSHTTDKGRTEMKCEGLIQNSYTDDILCYDEIEQKNFKTSEKLNSDIFKDLLSGRQSNRK
jgi:hypothetical protein